MFLDKSLTKATFHDEMESEYFVFDEFKVYSD